MKLIIEIENYRDVPKGHDFVAVIKNPEYKGIVVVSDSVSGCLKELSISLSVLKDYKANATLR